MVFFEVYGAKMSVPQQKTEPLAVQESGWKRQKKPGLGSVWKLKTGYMDSRGLIEKPTKISMRKLLLVLRDCFELPTAFPRIGK
jgi:hypothetical protein